MTRSILYQAISQVPSRAANSVHVMRMCEAIHARGQLELAVLRKGKLDLDVGQDVFSYYGMEDRFPLKRLSVPEMPGAGLAQRLLARAILSRTKAELIYTRDVEFAALAVARKFKVIYESHSPISDKGPVHERMFLGLLESGALEKLVVISHALEGHYLETYGIGEDRVVVAPDAAVDPIEGDAPDGQSERQNTRLRAGYLGSLYKGRGIELIATLARTHGEIDFVIAGGSPDEVTDWASRTAEIPNIRFVGHIAHSRVHDFARECDVLLAPYQHQVSVSGGGGDTGRWMSPLKLFEYMACGRPIVASRLPVLEEVLQDGENALLCDPQVPDEWSEALSTLERSLALRAQLGENARRRFLERHTWGRRVEDILARI